MENLSKVERELVAIGASIASNCVPCIDYHIKEARKNGISDEKIREAVDMANKVKQVPAKKILDYTHSKLSSSE
ncbi:MAG: carboxymuconolactone decarboxylase family protein [Deltaproteobacteria bacterium]|nr:carboxymuconolactone decarboxylase family protein [Deltaproteobacteria bacterium]